MTPGQLITTRLFWLAGHSGSCFVTWMLSCFKWLVFFRTFLKYSFYMVFVFEILLDSQAMRSFHSGKKGKTKVCDSSSWHFKAQRKPPLTKFNLPKAMGKKTNRTTSPTPPLPKKGTFKKEKSLPNYYLKSPPDPRFGDVLPFERHRDLFDVRRLVRHHFGCALGHGRLRAPRPVTAVEADWWPVHAATGGFSLWTFGQFLELKLVQWFVYNCFWAFLGTFSSVPSSVLLLSLFSLIFALKLVTLCLFCLLYFSRVSSRVWGFLPRRFRPFA